MAVLSKAIMAIAVLPFAAEAVQKKKMQPVKRMFTFMAAATAATDPATVGMKWAASQDELSTLLKDKNAMKERFHEFMTDKYGPLDNAMYGENSSDPKYLAFSYNVALAHERNEKSNGETVHGITGLMDLTRDEFHGLLGYEAPEDYMKGSTPESVGMTRESKTPDAGSKDWRDAGAVTPVKDQGQCGSCWAFSTVESIESAALAQGLATKSEPFIGAPQELVDCDTNSDMGCNGGLPANAFKYLKTTPLEPETDYKYKSGTTKHAGTCKLDKSDGEYEVVKATQTSIWGIGENEDMKDYMMTKGPLSVAVAANDAWQTYTGGVMTHDECPDNQPNHAVQAVALNMDAEKPYWTIRNSWNTNWGEDGYIRITYNENTCNVAYESMGVEVKKADKAKLKSSSVVV